MKVSRLIFWILLSYYRSSFQVPTLKRIISRATHLKSQPILKSHYQCIKEWYVNNSTTQDAALKLNANDILRLPFYIQCQNYSYFDTITSIKKSIRKGLILVNGIKADNQYTVQPNDYIQYMVRSSVDTVDKSSSSNSKSQQDDESTLLCHR